MKRLPNWMRGTLIATAIYNAFGVLLFIPVLSIGRRLIGITDAHPFYLWLVTISIGSFGGLYVWVAAKKRSETAFLIVAVIGKFAFWSLNLTFWLIGDFRVIAPIVASGDLITAVLFATWLWQARGLKDFSSQE
jgi:hypothetical protein